MTQEILPPLTSSTFTKASADNPAADPDCDPNLALDPDTLPPTLRFTPVPRNGKPWMGITPQRQASFIAHLAGSGSVTMAAKAIGVSTSALYQLRKAEAAESFAAAWEVAVDMGARRVLDTLMDHAIHGIPETLSKDGQIILERRKYNTRAMMWIVQQRFPEIYGGNLNALSAAPNSMPHGLKKLKDAWQEEWQKEWEAQHQGRAAEEETNAALLIRLKILHKRNQHEMYVPWMDDPEKRAACEVLYGAQDWEDIRRRAHKAALNGRLEPEVEARLGYKGR
jgi:hypothetical protein